uniref:exodeoxyribonuclease III n=1 Tax=Amphiprion ocellaris TaxID=80972 RepID=A0AAQ5Y5I9_AMPOC
MTENGTSSECNKKGTLTFCSWNVNGINEPVKRGKVIAHLKSLHADVVFLQETHLKNDAHCKIRAKWIGQVFHSKFPSKARGAAVIIRKNVPFLHKSTIADKEGRFVIVIGEIQSLPITLLNIYGPNKDEPDFFKKTFDLIPDISTTNLIMGSDFNLVLDTYLDR